MRVYFHNDLDGRAAGAIVWRTIGKNANPEMIEVDYKDDIDMEKIKTGDKIIIVDFSFKPEVMEEVLRKTTDIIWIDHHGTAFEYKYSQRIEGLRDEEFSGCELAWKYFVQSGQFGDYDRRIMKMPRAIELIGDRDKWAWKFGQDTARFNAGLLLHDHQPESNVWDNLLGLEPIISEVRSREIDLIMEQGKTCLKFRDQICEDYAKSYGFETEFKGYKCFALGLYMFGSEAFGDRMNKYDICLSYEYLGDSWTVGLYSKTVDVSKIAQEYNGGGHRGASGFVTLELPFTKKLKG